MKNYLILSFLVFFIALPSSITAQDWNKDLTPEQKIYILSKMWKDVSENFAFFENVPDLDWDKQYQEYIPKILATKTKFETYRLLERFICSLKDGHTLMYHFDELFPHYKRFNFNNNLRLYPESINKRVYITRVGGEEMTKTIPLGTEIIEVNNLPVKQYLEESVFPYISASTEQALWYFGVPEMFRGLVDVPQPYQWDVKFKKPDGTFFKMTLTLTKQPIEYEGKSYPKSPDYSKEVDFRWLDNKIAYVALNTFAKESAVTNFKSLIPELKKANSVILDIRFNQGGNTNIGAEILSYFTDAETLVGSKWKTRVSNAYFKSNGWNLRNAKTLEAEDKMYLSYYKNDSWMDGDTMKFANNSPSQDRLRMPLVVLTGTYTVSAGEDFLIMLEGLEKRAVTVGQRTSGSSGQRLGVSIPTGGIYLICTKKDTYPDGKKFVGVGIIPNIEIEPTIEDVLNGNDVILKKAVEVLKSGGVEK